MSTLTHPLFILLHLQDDLTSKAHALEIAQSAANRPRLPSAGASPSQADRWVPAGWCGLLVALVAGAWEREGASAVLAELPQ